MSYTNPLNFIKMLIIAHTMQFLQECGVRSYGELDILIPNNWDLKGVSPAGISKIGIKQHLVHHLLPWLLTTSRVMIGTCDTKMAPLQPTTKKIEGCKVGLKNMHFLL